MKGDGECCLTYRGKAASPGQERRFLTPLDLLFEAVRRLTFARWDESQLDSTQLARSGFFFTGVKDHVQCIICLGILGCWTPGEDADEEHRRQFPTCPLANGEPTGNIPVDASSRDGAEGRLYRLLGEYYLHRLENSRFAGSRQEGRPQKDTYTQFSSISSRLATYTSWPAEIGLSPQSLAVAGFFHTGRADWVQCFSCGGGVFGWRKEEQPLEVHLRYYPQCPFARTSAAQKHFQAPCSSGVNGAAMTVQAEDADLLVHHPLAKRLIEMGVPQTLVKTTFHQRLESHGAICRTILEAFELVFQRRQPERHIAPQATPLHLSSLQPDSPQRQNSKQHISTNKEESESVRREVEDLKQQLQAEESRLLCRVCKRNRVAVVLQPCSHLHLCVTCARPRDTCPTCHADIRGTLRPLISC
ncbi:baculoviral IAP repeat-containing protein 2-like [Penaeus japonicus]|uniref:baculoviral IAP repeat-containing protein 2-like n=1 Tax=Penaeus japonicus TaxID=27405 RepID=UPI001C70D5F3|nr:baculoviral IAP repeat-containing protein 2-like [Penaeus japonicus]XP_042859310.1 baculoviral IAP repeat-containing protein 2-like [Penaeus japonicus]